jgi:hypothetical protein
MHVSLCLFSNTIYEIDTLEFVVCVYVYLYVRVRVLKFYIFFFMLIVIYLSFLS